MTTASRTTPSRVVASLAEQLESGTLWAADATWWCRPTAARRLSPKPRQPAYAVEGGLYRRSGGGRNMDADVSIVLTTYAQRVELAITNANSTYAAELVTLAVRGIPVSGSPTIEETQESILTFWTSLPAARPGRTKLLRGNAYLQTQAQAEVMASSLRDRYQPPRLSRRTKTCRATRSG
ncbi:MAG: hypothetical protein IPK16_30720 [Anaerolineales bacterium]|nr:hypothetical protein [Anaerolineales bacterium]